MRGDIRVGECLVRSQLNCVRNGDSETKLEPKAMQVLALLLQRPGDVVSREEILSSVWQERFVSDEVLTNVVSQIRRALGDTPRDSRYIQTIAKTGYRLIAPVSHPASENASRRWLAAGVLASLVSGIFVMRLFDGSSVRTEAVPSPGLVVIREFDNLSRDPDLEWLRTGIAELMVTGLSQSTRLHVVGPSQDAVFRVSEGRNADLVITGSFARAKGRFRIDALVKDPSTGKIVAAESVHDRSEGQLFEMVDELSTRMSVRLELVHDQEPHLSRALSEVATREIDAYRHYVEAMRRYYFNLDHVGALERYRRAVELDPSFAMAHAKMGILYMNVGDYTNADISARRALEHVDRLPNPQRHYVTGNYYVTHEEDYARALQAYNKTLELDSMHLAARHNIAFIYFRLERYREAIEGLERLVDSGVRFPGSYRLLMMCYAALGEFEEGQRVADAFVAQNPGKWIGYRNLGQHLMRAGKLADAGRALHRADALRPQTFGAHDPWQLKLLLGEAPYRTGTQKGVQSATLSSTPHLGPALQSLYVGKPRQALGDIDGLMSVSRTGSHWAPVLLNLSASTLLQLGENARCIETAERAQTLGRGNATEWQARSLAAQARARLGDWSGAEQMVRVLSERTASIPSHKERRRLHHLRGELALLRGDFDEALEELRQAEGLLSPRGFPITVQTPQHVPIRFAFAQAYRGANRPKEAIRWYQSITQSTTERLMWPIPFVRSFYQLGLLHESEGNHAAAVSNYEQFLGFWERGELDLDEVQEARRRLASYLETHPQLGAVSDRRLYARSARGH